MIDREDCIKIGEVGKPHHLQGALIVYTEEDLLGLPLTEPVFLLLEGAPVPFYFSREGITQRSAASYIVKFDFVDSKEQAERLTGSALLIDKQYLAEEEELSFEFSDLTGFSVVDLLTREKGEVTDVANYSGNVVLTIQLDSKEVLIPLSEVYVKEILTEEHLLHVEIPDDLRELY